MATVYDKSSLFLAPSGVSNGTVFVQKPVPIYGGELVTNGDFAIDSDWTKGTGWSIIGGTANFDDTANSGLSQSKSFIAGKTYKISFKITQGSGSIAFLSSNGVTTYVGYKTYDVGVHSATFEYSTGSGFQIFGSSFLGGSFSIDNVSVKEVLSPDGDFTFTRGSNLSATRVNEAQLIEKGRENLLLQSNQFDTTWTNANTTETGGQAGYNGTNDAWLLSGSGQYPRIQQSVSSSGVNTISVYAKANTNNYLFINMIVNATGAYACFDLVNRTETVGLATQISSNITDIGNGWCRVSLAFSGTLGQVNFGMSNDGTVNGWVNFTSGSIYIQDAQLEQGLAATSVITTGGGTVQAGLLENTPRLDYSGGSTCPSLLLEPSRSNLVVTSEYAGGSGWFISSGYSVSQNVAISPEGVQNAFELTIPSINGNTRAIVSVSPSTEYTFSFYVKRGTATELKYSIFNLTNNTNIIAQTSYYSQTSATEWKRIEVTFTTPAGCTSAGVYIDRDSQADGTAFFYGLQCEAGSYATSYIPTYGSSVTRVGETCIKTSYPDLSSQQELTLYTEFNYEQSGRVIAIGNGTTSTRFFASYGSAKQMYMYLNIGGTLAFFLTSPNDTLLDGKNKVAVKIKSGESLLYLNGTEIFNNTSTFTLSGFQNVYIGTSEYGSTNDIQKIDSALIFYTALTDLQLAILTGATTYETFDEMALALNYTVYE